MRIFIFIPVLMVLALLTSCSGADKNQFDNEYEIGFIETTGNENTGLVTLCDITGNMVSRIELDVGGILPWNSHKNFSDCVYLGANGLDNQKNSGTVLEVNKNNGEIVKHKIWYKPITAIGVNEDYIVVSGNLNHVYQIASYNKSTKSTTVLELEDSLILYMEVYEDKIYAFSSVLGSENASLLYVVDISSMKVLEKIDISACGSLQLDSCMIGDILYFACNRSIDDGMSTFLYGLDTTNHEILSYDMINPFPYQIEEYNNQLMISHYDPVNLEGNGLTVFDLDSYQYTYHTLSDLISQFEIYEDKILVASFPGSGRMDSVLRVYSLDDFELLNTIPLNLNSNHYFVSFFTKEKLI